MAEVASEGMAKANDVVVGGSQQESARGAWLTCITVQVRRAVHTNMHNSASQEGRVY